MSVKREKLVGDDPLSSMLFGPEPEVEETVEIKEPRKPHTKNLKNTLSGNNDDFMKFEAKPQNFGRTNTKSTANDSKSSSVPSSRASAPIIPEPAPVVQKKPTGPTSVFESGDDVFLKSGDAGGISAASQRSLEEELFGPSATPLGSISSSAASAQRAGLGRFTASYEDDYEGKLDDLGVSNIMEREELDFDLFGKSKVRQLDAPPEALAPAPKIYQEDLTLQSEDEFAAMEAVLNASASMASLSFVSAAGSDSHLFVGAGAALDASTMDINAYIMQQESEGGAGLFD
jgi:hypothetical protein